MTRNRAVFGGLNLNWSKLRPAIPRVHPGFLHARYSRAFNAISSGNISTAAIYRSRINVRIEITTRRKRVREWVLLSLIAGTLLDALSEILWKTHLEPYRLGTNLLNNPTKANMKGGSEWKRGV
jgi:hypothetical protein